jgi:hypothetical protein
MGSGTYDRLTFIPESGVGQDEIFYLRGTELARPLGRVSVDDRGRSDPHGLLVLMVISALS